MEVIDKGLVLVSVHMFRPVIASPVLLLSIVEHAWLLHIFILPTNIVVTVNRVGVESLGLMYCSDCERNRDNVTPQCQYLMYKY